MSKQPMLARDLEREAQAAAILVEQIKDVAGGDEDFIRDTIEGETSLLELLSAMAASVQGDEAIIEGIKGLLAEWSGRRDRIAKRVDMKRALMANAMEIAGITKHEAPACTITVKAVSPKAIITQEADIPSRFYKPQPPKLDKSAVLAALKEREAALNEAAAIEDEQARAEARQKAEAEFPAISGAVLSNGGKTIQLR